MKKGKEAGIATGETQDAHEEKTEKNTAGIVENLGTDHSSPISDALNHRTFIREMPRDKDLLNYLW